MEEIDDAVYVADTPDRLLLSKSNVTERREKENDKFVEGEGHSRDSDSHHQSFNQTESHTNATKQGGCNRVLKFKVPRKIRTDNLEHSDKCIIDLSSSPSPSNSHRALKFRRAAVEKPIAYTNHTDAMPSTCQVKSTTGGADPHSQEYIGHHFRPKDTPYNLIPDDSKREEKRQGSLKLGGGPSNNRNVTSRMCGYSSKGKEKPFENCSAPLEAGVPHVDNMLSISNSDSPCQTSVSVAPKVLASASKPLQVVESPKRGLKRFVRNGLISPQNIAKGKMVAGQNSSVRDAKQNKAVHIDPWAIVDISESSAEGNPDGSRKGKGEGVKSHLQISNSIDRGIQNFYDRDTVIHTKDSVHRGANEEVGNWRHTHTCPRNIVHPLSNSFINYSAGLGGNQNTEERMYGTNSQNGRSEDGENHQFRVAVPASNSHARVIPQRVSDLVIEPTRGTKRRRGAHSSTRQQRTNQVLPTVLNSEPSSSRVNGSGCSNSDNMDARNLQLEADARLARELQEQLYQEDNLFNGSEMDANIALALHQDDQAEQASAIGARPVSNHNRGASVSHRMPRVRSSQPSSRRRGARSRLFGFSRGTQPRRSVRVSGSSNFLGPFPFDMSVDTRLDILEAWEAASDDITGLGILDTLFQAGHDFDENDYDRLLALDENNHEQGATTHQINILPLSTVQTDNFDDNCAICLETPGVGETIRHLPCFHKFHKECIDQWLGRKTSCPICKSSITQS